VCADIERGGKGVMLSSVVKVYVTLLRGLLVLALASELSGWGMIGVVEDAARSVRRGLVSLERVNAALGM